MNVYIGKYKIFNRKHNEGRICRKFFIFYIFFPKVFQEHKNTHTHTLDHVKVSHKIFSHFGTVIKTLAVFGINR